MGHRRWTVMERWRGRDHRGPGRRDDRGTACAGGGLLHGLTGPFQPANGPVRPISRDRLIGTPLAYTACPDSNPAASASMPPPWAITEPRSAWVAVRPRGPWTEVRNRLRQSFSRPSLLGSPLPEPSVPEVADPREQHRHTRRLGGRDHVRVAHRAARLHERRDAGVRARQQAVWEWEERVRCAGGTAHPLSVPPSRQRAARCRPGSSAPRPHRRECRPAPRRSRSTSRGGRAARRGRDPATPARRARAT